MKTSSVYHVATILIGTVILSSSQGLAADCKPLTRVASLDTTSLDDHRVTVPVGIEGSTVPMLIDTGAPVSSIASDLADSLKLPQERMYENTFVTSNGQSIQYIATVHDLSIGDAHTNRAQLLVDPNLKSREAGFGGLLGVDFLRNYDVEFDIHGHKLNLMRSDHCPGVVYWPASAIAVVPMHEAKSGHIVLSLVLDGKPVSAILDTGADETYLTDTAAQRLFGLTTASPGMNRIGPDLFSYSFNRLDLNGIAFGHISIVIHHDYAAQKLKADAPTGELMADVGTDSGVTDLVLGMKEMRNLHFYLAYGEGRLYATPVESEPAQGK